MGRGTVSRSAYFFGYSLEIIQCCTIHLLRLTNGFLHGFNTELLILQKHRERSSRLTLFVLTCNSCSAYSLVSKYGLGETSDRYSSNDRCYSLGFENRSFQGSLKSHTLLFTLLVQLRFLLVRSFAPTFILFCLHHLAEAIEPFSVDCLLIAYLHRRVIDIFLPGGVELSFVGLQ